MPLTLPHPLRRRLLRFHRWLRERPEPHAQAPVFEQLEPRMMMSATLQPVDWNDSIDYADQFIEAFVAEGRIGDRDKAATHELDLGRSTASPAVKRQFHWTKNAIYDFSLRYEPDKSGEMDRVTFTQEGASDLVYWTNWEGIGADSILIRAHAGRDVSSASIRAMWLDQPGGESIRLEGDDMGFAAARANGPDALVAFPSTDVIQIRDLDLHSGFTLRGTTQLGWGETVPKNSHLAYQIKVGDYYDIDLDIDSDNDNGFSLPDRSPLEELMESFPLGGKMVAATTGDIDGDGRIDFADVDGIADGRYVPLVLELPSSLDAAQWTDLVVTFDYDASNPHHITGSGSVEDPFQPNDGLLRLWRTDAGTAKDYGTDWIAPNTPISFSDLGVTPGSLNSITLFVEAVRPFQEPVTISVSVDLTGDVWSGTLSDSVRVAGTSATLHLDANHDGVVQSDGSDATDRTNPFRFWVNNDIDAWDDESEVAVDATTATGGRTDGSTSTVGRDNGLQPNSAHIKASVERDLEDFTRGGIWIDGYLGSLFNRIDFSLENASDSSLAVRVHASAGLGQVAPGSLSASAHLLDSAIHADAITRVHSYNHSDHNAYRDVTVGTAASISNAHIWGTPGVPGTAGWGEPQTWRLEALDQNQSAFILPFLMEGEGEGSGDLVVRVYDNLGNVQATSRIQIELLDVRDLYEHWTHAGALGDRLYNDATDPKAAAWHLGRNIVQTADSGTNARAYANEDEVLIFVHGWRMNPEHRRQFAETAYKRLYWQGYQGSMALYSWPTLYHDAEISDYWGDPGNFNKSEEVAWHAAEGLHQLLSDKINLHGSDDVSVIAHSMGGIVTSEALKMLADNDQRIDTAILSQAAVSAHFYNGSVGPREYPDMSHISPLLSIARELLPYHFGSKIRVGTTDYWYYHGLPYVGPDAVGGMRPRFHTIDDATTKLINFYNPSDYALGGWEYNMTFTRPLEAEGVTGDDFPGFATLKYEVDRFTDSSVYRVGANGVRTRLTTGGLIDDTYETYAHTLSSISNAIGQLDISTATDGNVVFDGFVDLKTSFGFSNASSDHSGQFYGSISDSKVRGYWDKVAGLLR